MRRNAIKLITKLVQTHPFDAMHGGRLQQKEWANRLAIVEAELDTLQPAGAPELANETVNTALLEEPTQMDIDPPHQESEEDPVDVVSAVNAAIAEQAKDGAVKRLQLQIEYYTDALAFIETLHTASHAVCQLLSSKNKNEVIEAMDFFVTMDAYHIETSKVIGHSQFSHPQMYPKN